MHRDGLKKALCQTRPVGGTEDKYHRDGSSVMFPWGSRGISGLPTSVPFAQMTQLALIFRQLPSRQLTCVSFTQGKWLQKWFYLCNITFEFWQQPIKAWLLWWLLKFSFKIGRPLCSCFPYHDDVEYSPICMYFFFPSRSFLTTYNKNIVHEYKIANKTNRLRFEIEI